MSEPQSVRGPARRLAWILSTVFLVALVMGTGPGLLLVNEPVMVPLGFGLALPALYAWGLLWYAVEVICVVLAYAFVWRDTQEE